MALEDATEAQLPFGMGAVDLTNPVAALALIVSLILGATIWNMTDSIGANFAESLNSYIGQFSPIGNPAEDGGSGGSTV